jgi:prepilin-type N-terminal cleavage/methylation domain-containing protein
VFQGKERGFTLIELSIVLVIIGLIVGGVLTGQTLIAAAGVRAQISQIEKYNTAANTFFGKYGYLPGDIPSAPAAQFGFASRGSYAGEGDGNGQVCGVSADAANSLVATSGTGETAMFWDDLSTARLIDGGYSTASSTQAPPNGTVFATTMSTFLPPSKIGNGNFLYVWCAATGTNGWSPPGMNYFGLSVPDSIGIGNIITIPGLTVAQASAIDAKVDDGLPQTGRVLALYMDGYYSTPNPVWASTSNYQDTPAATLNATAGSSTTCYDNNSTYAGTMKYSLTQNNGAGVNCALSFQMQAGD